MFTDDTVEDIFFASQFPPAGAALDAMVEKAEQGAHVTILLQERSRNGLSAKLFQRKIKGKENIQVIYHPGDVHSKLALVNTGIRVVQEGDSSVKVLAVEGKKRKGIVSSNNLHPAGYLGGTGEAGFQIEDQEILAQIVDKVSGDITIVL
jgi:hypothetical protein